MTSPSPPSSRGRAHHYRKEAMKKRKPITVASLVEELQSLPQDEKIVYAYLTYKGRKKRVRG